MWGCGELLWPRAATALLPAREGLARGPGDGGAAMDDGTGRNGDGEEGSEPRAGAGAGAGAWVEWRLGELGAAAGDAGVAWRPAKVTSTAVDRREKRSIGVRGAYPVGDEGPERGRGQPSCGGGWTG